MLEQAARDFQITCDAENMHQHQIQMENAAREAENLYQIHINSLPLGRRPYLEPVQVSSLGQMDVVCQHCHALHFDGEKLSKSTRSNKLFGQCCLQGQIQLPPISEPPNTLKSLLWGTSLYSKTFTKDIRQYNAAFAFTSMDVKIDQSVT
jgi:hypothetical protein